MLLACLNEMGPEPNRTPILIALAFAIGTGSFLFHTHATQWANLADSAPIVLFVILCKHQPRWTPSSSLAFVVYSLVSPLVESIPLSFCSFCLGTCGLEARKCYILPLTKLNSETILLLYYQGQVYIY